MNQVKTEAIPMKGKPARSKKKRHGKRKTKMNEVKTEAIPMKGKPGGGPRVWFDGDRTDIDPLEIKASEDAAALAIDVYNKTHVSILSLSLSLLNIKLLFFMFSLNATINESMIDQ
ncbi:hypothetical protein ACP275_06G050100 [Erythranthe tilingii]